MQGVQIFGVKNSQAARAAERAGDDIGLCGNRQVEPVSHAGIAHRRAVQPHDQPFEHQSERPDHERRRDHAGPDRQAGGVGQVGDVGTEQDEFALREVEDAHHAGDDPEPQHHQHDDGPEAQDFEQGGEQVFHSALPADGPRARYFDAAYLRTWEQHFAGRLGCRGVGRHDGRDHCRPHRPKRHGWHAPDPGRGPPLFAQP